MENQTNLSPSTDWLIRFGLQIRKTNSTTIVFFGKFIPGLVGWWFKSSNRDGIRKLLLQDFPKIFVETVSRNQKNWRSFFLISWKCSIWPYKFLFVASPECVFYYISSVSIIIQMVRFSLNKNHFLSVFIFCSVLLLLLLENRKRSTNLEGILKVDFIKQLNEQRFNFNLRAISVNAFVNC